MTTSLLVFAKAPVAGVSKTRLIPLLGAEGAARAHEELTEATLIMTAPLARTSHMRSRFALSLWGGSDHPQLELWSQRYDLPMHWQCEGDLGDRMLHALTYALSSEAGGAILVGSDCPVMTADYVDEAQQALDKADVVLGPAEDGGYVLIGCRRPYPEIFADIQWGSDAVLSQTIAKATALDLSVTLLGTLWDVDRPEDWQRYLAWKTSGLG